MATSQEQSNNGKVVIAIVVLIVVILLPLGYSAVCFALSKGTQSANVSESFLEQPKDKGECVRDKKYMRYNHWVVLYEMRDMAMRQGKKPQHNLKDCYGCHTSRTNFCDKCHNVVNFNPDCFGCHYFPK
ncbi:MAG: hypothetical protein ACYS8W_16685 [Planctomycetota bacterium]